MARFLGKDSAAQIKPLIDKLYALTDENGAEFDAEADAFLTALAQKDYAAVGDFCRRWNITQDSVPGYVITRIMEPIHSDFSDMISANDMLPGERLHPDDLTGKIEVRY